MLPDLEVYPLVCDLNSAEDLPGVLEGLPASHGPRVFTFLGMIPNFEPEFILRRLRRLLRRGDFILFSANLAPGEDYLAGMNQILPLYDNALTREWLMTFLFDLSVEPHDGRLEFCIEDDPGGKPLKRIAAYFSFTQPRKLAVQNEEFHFRAGDSLRLFFSYRHTPTLVGAMLREYGMEVRAEWITRSQEEGVFLVSTAG